MYEKHSKILIIFENNTSLLKEYEYSIEMYLFDPVEVRQPFKSLMWNAFRSL
ncbi:hypothetical protein BN168_520021 [Clostridioides difficile CD002]|nr:hypothetical protein BN168_520021 [Clostridioides difficile CD002]